jgi:tRNA (cmo5U34)-methyltransferase
MSTEHESPSRDKLFATELDDIAGFRFDANVANVFPDMIQRSVPGYQSIVAMTGTLAERYGQANSTCYDLGCSLGASTIAMRHGISAEGCDIIAVDNSAEMTQRCESIIRADTATRDNSSDTRPLPPVKVLCRDILDMDITQASMVVMNFTLQFIAPDQREALIERIYQGLNPGGIFILSEKIAFADQHLNELMIDLHHSFKRANHYSELEIGQKRSALENVLVPETLEIHRQRLQKASFSSIDVWFQCFNFASLLAIK